MRENKEGTDYGLRFMAEVLKVEHLHWAYFPEQKFTGSTITLTELKQAQLEYTKHLFTFIPENVHTILDVGAGLGKTASLLAEKGYQVHCLCNDKYQQTKIQEKYPAIPFTKSKFEECQLAQKFDLVLMSESVQYLNWPNALTKLAEVLNPGGYLLTCDYFRQSDGPFYQTCKVRTHFETATKQKFDLIKQEDITDFVLPTLEFAAYSYGNYILPSTGILGEALENSLPSFVKFLAKIFLGKQIKKAQHYLLEHTPEKFNKERFKQEMNYLIQLWRIR